MVATPQRTNITALAKGGGIPASHTAEACGGHVRKWRKRLRLLRDQEDRLEHAAEAIAREIERVKSRRRQAFFELGTLTHQHDNDAQCGGEK